MNKIYNDIAIVDESNRQIGHKQLPDALKAGDITRVSRVFIFNDKNELLLQKRSMEVIAPGLWCESAAGHIDNGESYIGAAKRELFEEIGVISDLTEIVRYFEEEEFGTYHVKRFNALFTAQYSGVISIDPEEVSETRWISLSELDKEILTQPENFTGGFIGAYNEYKKATNKG